MTTITLTPEELEGIRNTSSANQIYYAWVGILALRHKPLPMLYIELPEHIEGSTFQLNKE